MGSQWFMYSSRDPNTTMDQSVAEYLKKKNIRSDGEFSDGMSSIQTNATNDVISEEVKAISSLVKR